jgi:3-dehydroquinate synthase
MCDACFGGKTGVNFNGLKNYIGTFYNPKAILINVDALNTLDNLQFSSGLAEVIKHAFIDSNFLEFIESKKLLIKEKNKDVLKEMIKRSLEIKRTIVQADFQEKNEKRALLNFGHTVGHALESLSQFKSLSHGQAVSLGMVAEAFISYKLGYLKKEIFEKLQNLLRYFDLPTLFNIDQIEELISLMKKDKKSLSSSIPLIIIHDVGYLELFQITDINLLYPILLELSKNHG